MCNLWVCCVNNYFVVTLLSLDFCFNVSTLLDFLVSFTWCTGTLSTPVLERQLTSLMDLL